MVTHLTTSPPVLCLNRAERTGSLVFRVLWSYVKDLCNTKVYVVIVYTRTELPTPSDFLGCYGDVRSGYRLLRCFH